MTIKYPKNGKWKFKKAYSESCNDWNGKEEKPESWVFPKSFQNDQDCNDIIKGWNDLKKASEDKPESWVFPKPV